MTSRPPLHEEPIQPTDVGLGRLFHLIQEAIIVADTKSNQILLWNASAEIMFGYTEDEALSMPLETLVPAYLRERHLAGIKSFNEKGPGPLIRTGKPVELTALRKDGLEILIEMSLTTLEGAGSSPSCVMAMIRDVSERDESGLLIQLVRALPMGVFMTDGSGRPIFANEEAKRLLGSGILPEVANEPSADRFRAYRSGSNELYDAEKIPLVRALKGEASSVDDMEVRRPGGTFSIEVWGTPIFAADGTIKNAIAVFLDISSRREAEKALRDSEERFRQAFEHAPIGIGLVSLDGRYEKVNKPMCELLGYSEKELLTKTIRATNHPDDLEDDLDRKRKLLAGESDSYETQKRYVNASGEVIWVLLSVSLVRDAEGKPIHYISQNQDITDRKALEERLVHEASADPLTGLWNRRRFEEEVNRHLEEAKRYDLKGSVLYMDLDHLKSLNDTYGHDVGDTALMKLSAVLRGRFRKTDPIGRMGGDEFAVLLPRVGTAEAEEIALLLAASLRDDPLMVGNERLVLSASTGVASYDVHSALPELMKRADRSMYVHKREVS